MVDQERPWAVRMADEIGAGVHYHRDQRGMSAQDLAERCKDLGMPSITRTVITKLENKRRESVSTAELQVLAKALDVPAVLLLFPLGHAETVEVLPGLEADPWAAIEWFTGNSEDPANPYAGPQMGTRGPIVLWSEHSLYDGQIPGMWSALQDEISARGQASYPTRMQVAIPLRALSRIREVMRETGLTPPPLHPETARIMADVERGGGAVQVVLRKDMDELPRRGEADDAGLRVLTALASAPTDDRPDPAVRTDAGADHGQHR